MIPIAVVDDL